MKELYDCVVIGAGAAGMTAALYLKRYNLNVLILEKNAPGGVMNMTSRIDNYPGMTGINGTDLSMSMYNQLVELEVPYEAGEAKEIKIEKDYKIITTTNGEIKTKTIIIATGRIPRKLGLENEEELIGRGISWCAICDGFFYKDKIVAIIGGGNSALEESLYVATIAKKVYIINRNSEFKGDKILQEKVKTHTNVEIIHNSVVEKINKKEGKLHSIIVNNNEIEVDGMFLYIGYDPDMKCLKEYNIELENGYIKVDNKMQTSIEGIFACGDIIRKDVYQITTAAGEATIAATSVKDYLNN